VPQERLGRPHSSVVVGTVVVLVTVPVGKAGMVVVAVRTGDAVAGEGPFVGRLMRPEVVTCARPDGAEAVPAGARGKGHGGRAVAEVLRGTGAQPYGAAAGGSLVAAVVVASRDGVVGGGVSDRAGVTGAVSSLPGSHRLPLGVSFMLRVWTERLAAPWEPPVCFL
jgi:hypothetical protein